MEFFSSSNEIKQHGHFDSPLLTINISTAGIYVSGLLFSLAEYASLLSQKL
jgi:hypothetical protein